MNAVHRISLMFLLMVLSSGCAMGQKIQYSDLTAELIYQGSLSLAVGVYDNRPYVLDGQSKPEYAGTMRGGFGNPINAYTASGQPFANEFSHSIHKTFSASNFPVTEVIATPLMPLQDFQKALLAETADRYVLFVVNEWRSDSIMDTFLYYDVLLQIFDNQGKKLAENTIKGEDQIPGSAWNPPATAKAECPKYWSKHFSELLNSPKIRKALVP